MLKHPVGFQRVNNKSFDDYRNFVLEEFHAEKLFYKRKMTQGAFWTFIDKDLANQYFRDERWLFGIKFVDEVKLIDHGVENAPADKTIGFSKK